MTFHFDPKEHVYTLDGEPLNGTTTVIKNVMPPFLAKWGGKCAVDYLIAVGKPYYGEEGEDLQDHYIVNGEQLDKAVNAWSKVRKEKADIGTSLHKDLENYVLACIRDNNGVPLEVCDTTS